VGSHNGSTCALLHVLLTVIVGKYLLHGFFYPLPIQAKPGVDMALLLRNLVSSPTEELRRSVLVLALGLEDNLAACTGRCKDITLAMGM
jgi:hypothetical protein